MNKGSPVKVLLKRTVSNPGIKFLSNSKQKPISELLSVQKEKGRRIYVANQEKQRWFIIYI